MIHNLQANKYNRFLTTFVVSRKISRVADLLLMFLVTASQNTSALIFLSDFQCSVSSHSENKIWERNTYNQTLNQVWNIYLFVIIKTTISVWEQINKDSALIF